MKITKRSDIQTIASIVCDCLLRQGIDAVLSGGAVVSIYTNNEYESKDLDFISSSDIKEIGRALTKLVSRNQLDDILRIQKLNIMSSSQNHRLLSAICQSKNGLPKIIRQENFNF